jgi:DNA-directed RNA polymerase specialized sigma24 family protein
MARVQRRDQEAFTRLLDRHLVGLQKFLLRMTGNAADADEVSQEAFLRIWSHAGRWQADRVKFTTWLYRIARNLAIDRHRRNREATDEDMTGASTCCVALWRGFRNDSGLHWCCVTSTACRIRTRPRCWRSR